MNISLIGMMGSGKTSIGKLLAQKLPHFNFVDTDDEIVKTENKTINDIFKEYGEKYFRETETNVLNEILNKDNQIISTGGGIVLVERNLLNLFEKSKMIYLKADSDELYKRIRYNTDRPLLNDGDMKIKIKNLLAEREDKYKRAHFTIDTTNKTPDIIVKEITEKIGIC